MGRTRVAERPLQPARLHPPLADSTNLSNSPSPQTTQTQRMARGGARRGGRAAGGIDDDEEGNDEPRGGADAAATRGTYICGVYVSELERVSNVWA